MRLKPFLFFLYELFLGAIFICVQTTWLPSLGFRGDLLLLYVILLGLTLSLVKGGIFVLFLGYLSELHSAAPSGVSMIFLLATFLFSFGIRFLLMVRSSVDYMRFCFGYLLAYRLLWGLWSGIKGEGIDIRGELLSLLLSILASFLIYRLYWLWSVNPAEEKLGAA